MNPLAYIPKRRHLNFGADGWVCVGCRSPFDRFSRLWLHKIAHRHPFVGDGLARRCDVVNGVAYPRAEEVVWRAFVIDPPP